ncbi:MAG: DNA polymerase III subunit delta' [Rhodobacteraceae bacterium]|nr:DNA polymerase III subunit delta' [Paracoccaceae bacterium]
MSDDDLPESDRIEGAPRPRDVMSLIGQHKAETDFLEAFNTGRLHHAWLIGGPRGVGKATLAWRITRFLLTTEDGGMFGPPEDISSPADHPVTRRINALAEPGVFICRRPWDPKTKRLKSAITVDEVRKLKAFFTMSAADGGWRIAIVDAAEELNKSAANALLKILEEPPAKAMILLVSHQPAKLLPTIRSRCRLLRCEQLNADDLTAVLTQSGFESNNPQALAELSIGSPGDAIRLIAGDGLRIYSQIIAILDRAPRFDRPALIALGDSCAARGNADHYDNVVTLISLALVRLARFGAGVQMAEATANEQAVFQKLSAGQAQSRIWADLQQQISGRIAHARAVNLDPAQVILDTFIKIETAAAKTLQLTA